MEPVEQVDVQFGTRNLATSRQLPAFLPPLRPDGVPRGELPLATLAHCPSRFGPRFAEATTLGEVDAVIEAYRAEVHAGTPERNGGPRWLNILTQVGQVAATRQGRVPGSI